MSTDDSDSRELTRSGEKVAPAESAQKKPAPRITPDAPEEETGFQRRRASPALRLSAWLLAFVLLMVILGWALGEIL